MAIDPSIRMKVEAQLRLGKKPRELSEQFSIPYVTINNWSKKIKTEQADADIDGLVEVDEVTLHHMAEEIKAQAPTKKEVKKVEKLVEDVVGLKRLEEKTRTLSFSILEGVESYLREQKGNGEGVPLKELREASAIVSTLHNALFNKATTNVNVLNNTTIDSEKKSIFKASLGA